ncbi:hypothetical protein BaRGS_00026810, partial [Batillaria attramentaria]
MRSGTSRARRRRPKVGRKSVTTPLAKAQKVHRLDKTRDGELASLLEGSAGVLTPLRVLGDTETKSRE